jgi:hypothetical protein
MIANHNAEIMLCRAELRSGASPQARALARTMLAQRQAELAQLQRWHYQEPGTTKSTVKPTTDAAALPQPGLGNATKPVSPARSFARACRPVLSAPVSA